MADQEIQIHQTTLLKEITVEFNPEACPHKMEAETNEITVVYDERDGSAWRSKGEYQYGTFGAKIKCPSGDTTGLCFTFDLSSTTPTEFEPIHSISFYFLGDNKNIILTSANSTGNEDNGEQKHELGFDYSEGFHDYEMKWSKDFIEWSVDGEVIRRNERQEGKEFIKKPMSLSGSVWDASMVKDGEWAGDYDGVDAPYVCVWNDVCVPLLTEVAVVVTPVEEDPEDEESVKVDFRSFF